MNIDDLKPFVGTNSYREEINAPYSIGSHTYATNGHIIVRVPIMEGVAVANHGLATSSVELFAKHSDTAVRPLVYGTLPAIEFEERTCSECGTKRMATKEEDQTSVSIGKVPFYIKYIRLLQTLPSVRVQANPIAASPMYFTFEGGEGLLMPMSCEQRQHLEVQL